MLSAAAKRLEAQKLIRGASAALLVLIAPATVTATAAAQAAPVVADAGDPSLRMQAEALVPVLAGKPGYDSLFGATFRQAVPQGQFDALSRQLRDSLGAPRGVASVQPHGRWAASVVIDYARGTATMLLAVDPAAPHTITGLRITGSERRGDTAAAVQAAVAALPGVGQIGVYALDGAGPVPVYEVKGDVPAPLGSAFKLWVLAEAARQVEAGERRWSDVVPVGPPSLPSGILQNWPVGTPVTVQTLATLMISISDNTATDTLVTLLGRGRVDAMAARFGASGPVLTTREAFVIKSDAALTAAWTRGDADARRALLIAQGDRIAGAAIDPLMFSARPLAIESVEWFAAPRDMARLLAHLRDAGPVVRGILAVNHGVDPTTAGRFDYLGFKGGSEPGVIALNLLARTKAGRWYAVTGAWHRTDAGVDEAQFVALMTRALARVAE